MKNWRLEYSITTSILSGLFAFLVYLFVIKHGLRGSLVSALMFSVLMFLSTYLFTTKKILKKKAERDKLLKQLDKEEKS